MARTSTNPPRFMAVNAGHVLTILTILVSMAVAYGKFTAEFDGLRNQITAFKEQLDRTVVRVEKIDSEGTRSASAASATTALVMAHETRLTNADATLRKVDVLESEVAHLQAQLRGTKK